MTLEAKGSWPLTQLLHTLGPQPLPVAMSTLLASAKEHIFHV